MKREDRYLVIKRTDLDAAFRASLPIEKTHFETVCRIADLVRESRGKDPLSCVVVESDWPEYEPTWQAIEHRVLAENGCPQCHGSIGLKFPRGLEPYCEDCGWPDENRSAQKNTLITKGVDVSVDRMSFDIKKKEGG